MRHKNTQKCREEGDVKMKAEIGVKPKNIKDCWQSPETRRDAWNSSTSELASRGTKLANT